jgi:hypothetical protein
MTRKEFDKNASAYDIISDLVEGQYYANGNSYSYSAGYLSSVLVVSSEVHCRTVKLQRPTKSKQMSSVPHYLLGLKVFMDAHWLVTPEEGDRYPLRPPVHL